MGVMIMVETLYSNFHTDIIAILIMLHRNFLIFIKILALYHDFLILLQHTINFSNLSYLEVSRG